MKRVIVSGLLAAVLLTGCGWLNPATDAEVRFVNHADTVVLHGLRVGDAEFTEFDICQFTGDGDIDDLAFALEVGGFKPDTRTDYKFTLASRYQVEMAVGVLIDGRLSGEHEWEAKTQPFRFRAGWKYTMELTSDDEGTTVYTQIVDEAGSWF